MNPPFSLDTARFLEQIYVECNRRQRLDKDPLSFVVTFDEAADREVAGLVCSTLAFGSVELILRACEKALRPLGAHPAAALADMGDADLKRLWGGFQYRYCFPSDIQALLRGIREARRVFGSLEGLFLDGDASDNSFTASAGAFVRALRRLGERKPQSQSQPQPPGIRKNLLPDPADGSACKRLFLFFRWMVRNDDIDPGGWNSVSPARLIVPLDTHMAKTCRERLGFLGGSGLSSPSLRDALAVTEQFALYSPEDPVKYDFALTRPGIDPRPGDEIFGCL